MGEEKMRSGGKEDWVKLLVQTFLNVRVKTQKVLQEINRSR